MSLEGEVAGFSYLEPKRHVPHITELDGTEAATFGPVIARVTRALKSATGAEVIYLYVFGDGVPHLHIHLAPHRAGDPLNDRIIRGEVKEVAMPNGTTGLISRDFPSLPKTLHESVRDKIRAALESLDGVPRSGPSDSRDMDDPGSVSSSRIDPKGRSGARRTERRRPSPARPTISGRRRGPRRV